MPQLRSKRELSEFAGRLAKSMFVQSYRGLLYIPVDVKTGEYDLTPAKERRVWTVLDMRLLLRIASEQYDTMFSKESEVDEFAFMIEQQSEHPDIRMDRLLVKTDDGLKVLDGSGVLSDPDGEFVPNVLPVKLDATHADEVWRTIVEWLGDSEEEAHSLLHHCATALAPHWSAVKYVLLIGEGRNGKSILLSMLERVFGSENVSSLSRQDIADKSPAVLDLRGKLMNIVFDGQSVYLKDSGDEKSLVAGEVVGVRKLYRSSITKVQTNALFIEGLNREPKSGDKSSALQARLVRFRFPNVYQDDLEFKDRMLSDPYIGGLLYLLISHYVVKEQKAKLLAPTQRSLELKAEHELNNSLALQYLLWLVETGKDLDALLGTKLDDLTSQFRSWRLSQGDMSAWDSTNVAGLFSQYMDTERRTMRIPGVSSPRKVRVITGFKPAALVVLPDVEELEKEAADVAD